MLQKLRWLLLISAFLVVIASCCYADRDIYAGAFLDYRNSIRNSALGVNGAASSSSMNPDFFNPSLMTLYNKQVISSYYANLFWDDSIANLTMTFYPMKNIYTGIQFMQINVPGIEMYSKDYEYLGEFSAAMQYFGVSFASIMKGSESLGITFGWLKEQYDRDYQRAFFLDMGIHYEPYENFLMGFVFSNVLKSQIGEVIIKPRMTCGFTYNAGPLVPIIEYEYTSSSLQGVNLGVEYSTLDILKLRAGSARGQIMGGVGMEIGKLAIDYSLRIHELGNSNFISLSYRY